MKISVITINYNNLEGLKKSFDSLFNQTSKNFEYVVIDGGSSDGSKEWIESCQDNIDYWISEPDKGVYDAMNKGLNHVTGDYVFFLNSGDLFYSEETIAQVISYANNHGSKDIFYGDVIYVNPENKSERLTDFHVDKITLYIKMICHQAMFCKTDLFQKHGGFDLNFKIKADYEWFLRAVFNGATLQKIPITVAYYEEGGLSETHFNLYSAKEIPVIRNKYYPDNEQMAIRRFFLHPTIKKLPFYNQYTKFTSKIFQAIYPNLRSA